MPRVHCPEVGSKAKVVGNYQCTSAPTRERFETVFRTIISVNQLSIYGAVSDMCEECKTCHDRTGATCCGRTNEFLLRAKRDQDRRAFDDDHAHRGLVLQQYGERTEKLSQQDNFSKFCMDAGFLNVVEIGQFFMARDTAEFSQVTDAVACREYTLPRDESLSEPKGWIRGNTKIGPLLEVTTCCLQGKYGVEIRIESMNKDHSHSWVRISHGLNKVVTNLNDNEQETSVRRLCVKIECMCFCEPIKGQSETTKTYFCQLIHKNYTYWERTWTDIEPQDYSLTDYSVSK